VSALDVLAGGGRVAAAAPAVVTGAANAGEKAGVVALCALCALVIVARGGEPGETSTRMRGAAMLAVLALAPTLLLIDIWGSSPVRHLRAHAGLAVAAAAAALVIVAVLAAAIRRRPAAFPLLAVLALPFRLPIAAGGSTANLLIPLYVVVAAGTLAHLLPRRVPRAPVAESPGGPPAASLSTARRGASWTSRLLSVQGLQWLLAASIALYGIQATYSGDFSKALQNVAFFYAPFALLFVLLREARWSGRLLAQCFCVALGLAVVFAGIGFAEYARGRLFLNPKLIEANQYDSYFRVNSLFFDPNIYGRFLALVIIALAVVLLRSTTRRRILLATVALAWVWAGLLTSLSESSMAALLLGLAVLAAFRWDALTTAYVTVAACVLVIVVALAAPPSAHLGISGEGGSANNATSGRASLVRGGLSLFADRPLQGFGSGSFAREYRRHRAADQHTAVSASHTIPVTVAAEQGIVGLALYVALLVSAFAVLFAGAKRSPPGAEAGDARLWWASPFRQAIAACFAALVLHTWAYADFLEDPTTWTLLGIGVALAAGRAALPARAPAGWERAGEAAVGQGLCATT
jgi:O-antigen ligase